MPRRREVHLGLPQKALRRLRSRRRLVRTYPPKPWAPHRGDNGLLDALLAHLSPCDLVLVEGFKREAIPKLEVHRVALGKPLLAPSDPYVVALASDEALATTLPQFRLDDVARVADFIVAATAAVPRASLP